MASLIVKQKLRKSQNMILCVTLTNKRVENCRTLYYNVGNVASAYYDNLISAKSDKMIKAFINIKIG